MCNLPRTPLAALLALWLAAVPTGAGARTWEVPPGGSIQAAVDAAAPGDVIRVADGVFTAPVGAEAVVRISTSGLSLIGGRGSVIDADGAPVGIQVGPEAAVDAAGCPGPAVQGFSLRGFRVQGAGRAGVRLFAVDDFRLIDGLWLDNGDEGASITCSTNGMVRGNSGSGHAGAALALRDGVSVQVNGNAFSGNTFGIAVGNSAALGIRNNFLHGNAAGLWLGVEPHRPQAFSGDVHVTGNWVVGNNRTAPVTADVPSGTGILGLGVDRLALHGNVIVGNRSAGVVLLGNSRALDDARVDPFVDGARVEDNRIERNGEDADVERSVAVGADLVFVPDVVDPASGALLLPDPDPTDNCFAGPSSDFPPGVTALFPCR